MTMSATSSVVGVAMCVPTHTVPTSVHVVTGSSWMLINTTVFLVSLPRLAAKIAFALSQFDTPTSLRSTFFFSLNALDSSYSCVANND